jgi:phosphatidylserine/phosphatidylglycerophosphate/cardiolipin synthase-like enzyme
MPRLNNLANTKAFIDSETFFPQTSKDIILKLRPYIIEIVKKYGPLLGFDPSDTVTPFFVLRRIGGLLATQSIGAHHEKVIIVKGKFGKESKLVAFCGGMDINKNRVISEIKGTEYRFPYYHDVACRLEGPAAHQILQRFKRRWKNHPQASQVSILGENESEPIESLAPYPFATSVGTFNSVMGKVQPDRSGRDAYLKIIENAKSYIYIEDQYMVNLDVAKALNKKIKENGFSKLTLAIQDSIETSDIFIPNRKRSDFFRVLMEGANDNQKEKVLYAVLDRKKYSQEKYHPGMHAKTLIADEEIAIIGSMNINQRSFTNDSETSVIVFDEFPETSPKSEYNFAKTFRKATWKEFQRGDDRIMYSGWWNYPTALSRDEPKRSILIKYAKDEQEDLDVRINSFAKKYEIPIAIVGYELLDHDLTKTSVLLNPQTVTYIFDTIWEHFIEPKNP